tara:strand:- start:4552 stop:4935 length:384 start_codon:yes stop_codon:yes gene_type:complete
LTKVFFAVFPVFLATFEKKWILVLSWAFNVADTSYIKSMRNTLNNTKGNETMLNNYAVTKKFHNHFLFGNSQITEVIQRCSKAPFANRIGKKVKGLNGEVFTVVKVEFAGSFIPEEIDASEIAAFCN